MANGKRKQTSDDEPDYSGSESDSQPKKTAKARSEPSADSVNVAQKAAKPAEGSSKPKTIKKPKIGNTDDDGPSSPSRDQGSQSAVKVLKNAEGEKYVDLGKKKRAAVRSFKGQVFLDIREFYGTDGDEKPGKKGISLTKEQWDVFKMGMGTIDALFAEQGKK